MEEINGQRYRLTDGDYVEPTAGMRPTIIVSNTTLKSWWQSSPFDDKGISTEVTPTNQFIRDDFGTGTTTTKMGNSNRSSNMMVSNSTLIRWQASQRNFGWHRWGYSTTSMYSGSFSDQPYHWAWWCYSITLMKKDMSHHLYNTFVQDKDGDWLYLKDKAN